MTQPPEGWSAPGAEPAVEPAREAEPAPPAAAPPPGYGYGYGAPPPPPPGYPPAPGQAPPGYPPPPGQAPPPGYPPPPPPGYGTPGWGQPQPGWQQGWGAPVVTPGVVPLRPLAVGELLDGAVKVVRRYPRPTLGMSALVAVVTTVLNLLAVLAEDTSSFVNDVNRTGSEDSFSTSFGAGGSGLAGIPGAVVGLLGGLVLAGFLVAVVGKAVLGQPTSFAETWQQVRPRIWALIGLALLVGLICTGPVVVAVLVAVLLAFASPVTLVLGIPLAGAAVAFGVYAYGRLSLSSAVLVLEKAGIRESMRRSGVLVKGSWWRVFGILLLVQVIASVVTGILTVPFLLLAGINAAVNPEAGSFTLLLVVTQIGGGLATFLVAPFSAGARSLLYVDRRMRAEGLDLTLQAAARG